MMKLLPILLAALLMCSCSDETETRPRLSDPVLTRQYRKDSVTMIMSLSETNLLTSGKTRLLIDIQTPPEYEVTFPEIRMMIEPFAVANGYTEPTQPLPNGKHLHRRVWELVPNRAGNTTFQSFEIQAGTISVKTEPVTLTVRSILPPDITEIAIKDIAASINILPEQQKKRKWLFKSILILFGIGILTLLIIKRRRPPTVIEASPYEVAQQALNNLPHDPLERIHTLTEIVINYVGKQCGLITTGRTVDELVPLLPNVLPETVRSDLDQRLAVVEQIRFSNKVPDNFTAEWETDVRSIIEDMKEVPCD